MKQKELAQRGTYVGTGAGLIMFMLVGLFPGSLIGGAVGLWLSSLVTGSAADISIVPRVITSLSMVVGILGSAALFVVGSSVAGWAVGTALDAVRNAQHAEGAAKSY